MDGGRNHQIAHTVDSDVPLQGHEDSDDLAAVHSDLVKAVGTEPYRMSERWLDRACDAHGEGRRQIWRRVMREAERSAPEDSHDVLTSSEWIWSILGIELGQGARGEVKERLAARDGARLAGGLRLPPATPWVWQAIGAVLTATRAVASARTSPDWDDAVRVAAATEVVCSRTLARARALRTGQGDAELALVAGMLHRSMRLDYDLLVASRRCSPAEWIEVTCRRLGGHAQGWAQGIVDHPPAAGRELAALLALPHASRSPAEYLLSQARLQPSALSEPVCDPLSRDVRTDIPAKMPAVRVAISRVGTSRVEVPVPYRDSTTGQPTAAPCEIDVTVRLSADHRGVHMSRFQEAAMRLTDRVWSDLGHATDALAQDARQTQAAAEAEARLQARVFFRKRTAETRRPTMMPARLEHVCRSFDGGRTRSLYLTMGVMTACPCTLAFSKLKTARTLSAVLGVSADDVHGCLPSTFTHSQPGTVRVGVSGSGALPTADELFAALASSAHLVESVLKRPDEHALVERVHDEPQFCEDVARRVGVAVAARCARDDEVHVVVELDESIHPHRAFAELRSHACDLWQDHWES